MKRTVLLLTALLLVASMLTGCFGGTKEFTCEGMTITVPFGMRDVSDQSDFSSFTFALDSTKVAFFGLKEEFSDFNGADMTLEDYAKAVISANELDVTYTSRQGADYYYFSYEAELDGDTYQYLAGVYQCSDAFWLIQITSLTANYEEASFLEYLDSVKFA